MRVNVADKQRAWTYWLALLDKNGNLKHWVETPKYSDELKHTRPGTPHTFSVGVEALANTRAQTQALADPITFTINTSAAGVLHGSTDQLSFDCPPATSSDYR